ncbi:hypothetical protein DV736_g1124, partial [Chaetothyriales sp. CBS 134916]
MAPPTSDSKPMYAKDERALCFHGELLYEAKVLEVRKQDPKDKTSPFEYRVHYKGWKNTWDDWVLQDRLRKFTEDNKELAANLKRELIQQSQPKSAVKPVQPRSRKQGSDFGSGRGSEERHSSVPAGARGTKRGRDNDIEKTSDRTPASFKSRVTRRTAEKPVSELTLDELLAYSPSQPEPEYISNGTFRAGFVGFAPLLGGTTMVERERIEQELYEQGKIDHPLKAHAAYLKAKAEEPGNFAKHLFYEDLDPLSEAPSIAGVDEDPLELDPPGSGGPFDALKHPNRLIQQLNRDDGWTLSSWGVAALNKIPASLVSKIKPEVLAKMPDEVINRQQDDVRKKLPQRRSLPAPADVVLAVAQAAAATSSSPSTPTKGKNTTGLMPKRSSDGKLLEAPMRGPGGRFLRKAERDAIAAGETLPSMKPTPKPTLRRSGRHTNPLTLVPAPAVAAENVEVDRLTHDMACKQCLRMGLSCDWRSPVCGHCESIGLRCSFRSGNGKPGHAIPSAPDAGPAPFQSGLAHVRTPIGGHFTHQPLSQEENFVSRPSIRITIPDHLKNLLVDDWENVTKSLLLVPLPSRAPANYIIDSYFEEEKLNRRVGTGDADILEEFCAGLKVYFEKSIGKILLYRFERGQLAEVRKLWESGRYPDWENRGPGDCYGAEHLTRMLVNMPELIAQTNMDTQSVARLKEEISKFCVWLSRNSHKYFAAKYEKPSAEYIENAR